jgi:site-specific recombinase XerD
MALIRRWELESEVPKDPERATIETWKTEFLADAKSPSGRNLGSETYRKYVLLFKQLDAFAQHKGLRFVDQLDLRMPTSFRATWKDAPLSASKKLERLRTTLRFALRRKWIKENAADDLDSPEVRSSPTLPFTDGEMERILKAAGEMEDARVKPFILVMPCGPANLRCNNPPCFGPPTQQASPAPSENRRIRIRTDSQ